MNTPRSSRLQFLLIALFFIGPLVVAAWLYFDESSWRPAGQTNHGTLIQPVITLPAASLTQAEGGDTPREFLRGKWSLLYLERGDCDEGCRQALVQLRQIRLALGAEADRLQRVFLCGGSIPEAPWFEAGHSGLIYALTSGGGSLTTALDSLDSGLYIVDPLGNLMMRYPVDTQSKPIYQDLKKLLKLSRIG